MQVVGEWQRVWGTDSDEDEHVVAVALLTGSVGAMPHDMAPITRHDVHEAAKKFEDRIATPDGVHPKGVGLLSGDSKDVIATMLNVSEIVVWASQASSVHMHIHMKAI